MINKLNSIIGAYNDKTGEIETEKGGKMFCKNCYSDYGFKIYHRNYPITFAKCLKCNSKEKFDNFIGDILEQNINLAEQGLYKKDLYNKLNNIKKGE
jgi:hypothetical protein